MAEIIAYDDRYDEGISNLILSIQQKEFGIPITLEDQPDLLDINQFYIKGNGNFWIAVADGQVVGTIGLLDIGSSQGALRKMFVHRDFRGKKTGVAKRLLDALLDWCKQKGVRDIFLGTTSKFLASHRFYEKNGFKEIKKNQLPKSFPVMSVDSKFYRFEL